MNRVCILFAIIAGLAVIYSPDKAQADPPLKAPIAICSDDETEVLSAFAETMRDQLSLARVVRVSACHEPVEKGMGVSAAFEGAFEQDEQGWILFVLTKTGVKTERRHVEISWLESVLRPIEETVRAGKLEAFGMLIDGLLMDFRHIAMGTLKSDGEARNTAPEEEMQNEPVPDNTPRLPDENAKNSKQIVWSISLGAGIAYLTPDAVAPHFETTATIGRARFYGILGAMLDLDSNFEIEGRSFETAGFGTRLGGRYGFFDLRSYDLGMELALLWKLNSYRRDDIPQTTTRTWSDFGVGLALYGRVKVVGYLQLFARLGLDFYPSAQIARIKNGPKKRTNLFNVPGIIGVEFRF